MIFQLRNPSLLAVNCQQCIATTSTKRVCPKEKQEKQVAYGSEFQMWTLPVREWSKSSWTQIRTWMSNTPNGSVMNLTFVTQHSSASFPPEGKCSGSLWSFLMWSSVSVKKNLKNIGKSSMHCEVHVWKILINPTDGHFVVCTLSLLRKPTQHPNHTWEFLHVNSFSTFAKAL